MQIKMRYHHTLIKIAKIKNTDHTKSWRGCEGTGTHGTIAWKFKCIPMLLKNLNIPLSCLWIVLLKTWESLGQQGDVSPKGNQPWIFIGRTDTKAETPVLWLADGMSQLNRKKPWCWERLREGRKGSNRGLDDWLALQIQWTWVWANSVRYWRTGKPGVL